MRHTAAGGVGSTFTSAPPGVVVNSERPVYGVDFSGARDAGANVWVTTADVTADGLRARDCAPAVDALAGYYDGDPTVDRDATLAALRAFVAARDPTATVALDVSFGLPAAVARGALDVETWRQTPAAVADFDSASAFADACTAWTRDHADGATYLKRETDAGTGAFSPYHFFVKHQTYRAARHVLAPLIEADAVRVAPMDDVGGAAGAGDAGTRDDPDRPRLVEIYPAATLAAVDAHREGYKGDDAEHRRRRVANLEVLCDAGVVLDDGFPRERVLDDGGGDGLDSLVAAFAAWRHAGDPTPDGPWDPLEGFIYI
jgi:hypothetical protein